MIWVWVLPAALLLAGMGLWRWRPRQRALSRDVLLAKSFGKILDGERGQVLEEMRELYQKTGQDVGVGLALGPLFRRLGKRRMAIRMHLGLTSRPGLEPDLTALIYTELCADYLESGLLQRARQALEQALELQPGDELTVRYGERTLIRLKEWDAAATLLRQYGKLRKIGVKPRLAMLRYEEGIDLAAAGHPEEALVAFKKAVGLDPHCLAAHLAISQGYREVGKPGKALAYLNKKWQTFKEDPWLVYKELMKISMASNQPAVFLEPIRKHLEREPGDWRGRSVLGTYLMETGDFAGAAQQLTAALEVSPQTLLLHQKYWELLLRSADPLPMLARYQSTVSLRMTFSDPYECRGCLFHGPKLLWRCPACFRLDSFGERKI